MDSRRPRPFSRAFWVASGLHAFATAVAYPAFIVMTSGGGEGYRDTPAIERMAAALEGLAMPVAWLGERALNPDNVSPPSLAAIAALLLVNSLFVGVVAGAIWAAIRRPLTAR